MKKILCLILTLAMVFALVGCGKSEKTPDTKQNDVIEPYLDEEGNFVSSLSEFVVEPDKYFPKSTVETNSEDDGSRIMVYVEFCTQEEIDTYAADAKGERFVKMSYSDTDGKMWDDSEGWYSFAVMTEESGDDGQPLNGLFIYLVNSDFAYDLKHPKVEETPTPTVEPTPESTPEPTPDPEIRWDVIRKHVKWISTAGPVYADEKTHYIMEYLNNADSLEEAFKEVFNNEDEYPELWLSLSILYLFENLKEEKNFSDEEAETAAKMLQYFFYYDWYDYNNENLNTALTNDELELLETIYQNSEILNVLPEILSDY